MTKRNFLVLGLLLLGAAAFSPVFGNPAPKGIFDQWPELGAFPTVMSETFHPMEEGNFEPIRTRSGEMVQKAKALAKAKIPAEFNNPKMADAVKRLAKGSSKLNKMIKKKATDEQLTASLTGLHDVFHEIVGLCRDEKH
ncbi:MAG TPA: hypothetical protein PKB07_20990 [Flavilitoribacter sp.]|nr:hypothetical protein [Flavilitoribacter sp.]